MAPTEFADLLEEAFKKIKENIDCDIFNGTSTNPNESLGVFNDKKEHIYIRSKMDYSMNLEFGTYVGGRQNGKTRLQNLMNGIVVLNKDEYKIENEE